jgi:GNAT superfamily N-acetyltransferase
MTRQVQNRCIARARTAAGTSANESTKGYFTAGGREQIACRPDAARDRVRPLNFAESVLQCRHVQRCERAADPPGHGSGHGTGFPIHPQNRGVWRSGRRSVRDGAGCANGALWREAGGAGDTGFLGKTGIFIENLFVEQVYRNKGIGKALLVHLARMGREAGCGRLEWAVLNWNERAMEFYQDLGAVPMDEWTTFRLTGDALERLASQGEP